MVCIRFISNIRKILQNIFIILPELITFREPKRDTEFLAHQAKRQFTIKTYYQEMCSNDPRCLPFSTLGAYVSTAHLQLNLLV